MRETERVVGERPTGAIRTEVYTDGETGEQRIRTVELVEKTIEHEVKEGRKSPQAGTLSRTHARTKQTDRTKQAVLASALISRSTIQYLTRRSHVVVSGDSRINFLRM